MERKDGFLALGLGGTAAEGGGSWDRLDLIPKAGWV